VALNSPASGGKIGKDAPAVWESWKNISAVMVPPGQNADALGPARPDSGEVPNRAAYGT
jgi:hypothetical protein